MVSIQLSVERPVINLMTRNTLWMVPKIFLCAVVNVICFFTGDLAREIAAVIPYYPFKGIPRFYDIGGFLSRPDVFQKVINVFVERYRNDCKIDKIFGFDARGFVLGPPIALALQKPFYMLRKRGKMPNAVAGSTYETEYSKDVLMMQRDAVSPNDRCLLIDDLVATGNMLCMYIGINPSVRIGGTLLAGVELVQQVRLFFLPSFRLRVP